MKRICILMLLFLAMSTIVKAQLQNVLYGNVSSFGLAGRTNLQMTLAIYSPKNRIVNNSLVSNDPLITYSDQNGNFEYTNVIFGYYVLSAADSLSSRWPIVVYADTSGSNNLINLLNFNAAIPPPPSTNYYDIYQINQMLASIVVGVDATNVYAYPYDKSMIIFTNSQNQTEWGFQVNTNVMSSLSYLTGYVAQALSGYSPGGGGTGAYSTNSGTAQIAVLATNALNAVSAAYATNAGMAATASFAGTAGSASTALSANTANSATTANSAMTAGAATITTNASMTGSAMATNDSRAITLLNPGNQLAGNAAGLTNGVWIGMAYFTNAASGVVSFTTNPISGLVTEWIGTNGLGGANGGNATYATNSGTSQIAVLATNAINASYSTNSGTANTASFATIANSAINSTVTGTSMATNDVRPVSLLNMLNQFWGIFTGNGAGLTNLNIPQLAGFSPGAFPFLEYSNGTFWGDYNLFAGTNINATNIVGTLTNNTTGNALTATTAAFANDVYCYNILGLINQNYLIGSDPSLSGQFNTTYGWEAFYTGDSGSFNTIMGAQAGYYSTNSYNIFIGYGAEINNASGKGNTVVGTEAGQSDLSGGTNILIGIQAGNNNTSGSSFNIDIGNLGNSADSDVIRLGSTQTATYLVGTIYDNGTPFTGGGGGVGNVISNTITWLNELYLTNNIIALWLNGGLYQTNTAATNTFMGPVYAPNFDTNTYAPQAGGFAVSTGGTGIGYTNNAAGLTNYPAIVDASGTLRKYEQANGSNARMEVDATSGERFYDSAGNLQLTVNPSGVTAANGFIGSGAALTGIPSQTLIWNGGTNTTGVISNGTQTAVNTLYVGGQETNNGAVTFKSGVTNTTLTPSQPIFTDANNNQTSTGTVPPADLPAFTGDITTSAGSSLTSLKSTGTAGTYTKTTFDANGRETSGTTLALGDLPANIPSQTLNWNGGTNIAGIFSNSTPTMLAGLANGPLTNWGPAIFTGNSNDFTGAVTFGGPTTNVLANTNLVSDGAPSGFFGFLYGNGANVTSIAGANIVGPGNQSLFVGTTAGTGSYETTLGIINGNAGSDNTYIGSQAGANNVTISYGTAGYNVGVGVAALYDLTNGNNNVVIGENAGGQLTNGINNIIIGASLGGGEGNGLGYLLTAGTNNIYLGGQGAGPETNIIRIGASQTQTYIAGQINGNAGAVTNIPGFAFAVTNPAPATVTNYTVNIGAGPVYYIIPASAANVCFNAFVGTQGSVRVYVRGAVQILWPTVIPTFYNWSGLTTVGTNYMLQGTNLTCIQFDCFTNLANNPSLTNISVSWLSE